MKCLLAQWFLQCYVKNSQDVQLQEGKEMSGEQKKVE